MSDNMKGLDTFDTGYAAAEAKYQQRELELLAVIKKIRKMPAPVDPKVSLDRPIFEQWVKVNELCDSVLVGSSQALREHEAKVLLEAFEVADKHRIEMENTGGLNAEDSPGRDRCYARARTAKYISDELRRMAEERRKK